MSNRTCEHDHIDAAPSTCTNTQSLNAKCYPLSTKQVNIPSPPLTLTIRFQISDSAELTNNSFAINADLVVTLCNLLIKLDRPLKKISLLPAEPLLKSYQHTDELARSSTETKDEGGSVPPCEVQEVLMKGRSNATAIARTRSCRPTRRSMRPALPSSACEFDT